MKRFPRQSMPFSLCRAVRSSRVMSVPRASCLDASCAGCNHNLVERQSTIETAQDAGAPLTPEVAC